ncbi:hypothetical protein COT97_03270 [Candidatus Falkowbacteria bacterium CG10_big_fil_rev_8_21_14_0_10_39_11]|uniref:Major facilitator superfamily (MFS) profile domain-containing protein n=1 Tax=Candidatus Falkowbacteria bacterium CG10_big_fil_rev_8_21_14_0_10_39_11 TaxID=1974565 RepID=A0A2H0V6W7_9BACT|nr:MAG: hypothetical protein COT97_03270 [Candidatus Falkowbacteria bacterium CG10_big_fil_rev_8_21_14_0_10_39_11]
MNYRYVVNSIRHFKINIVVKVLIVSDFIVISSSNILSPIFAIFIAEQVPGGSIEAAGLAVAIYAMTKSIFEVPVGIFIDRKKGELDDLYMSFFGTLLQGVVYFSFVFVGNVWHLLILHAVLGFASAVAYPGWYAIFTRHVDDHKQGFEWSLYDVILGFGAAGAAAVGGFIAVKWGFNSIFIIVACLTFAGAFLLPLIRSNMRKN